MIVGDYWANARNRRHFFERFAADKGFDPLIAQNWYSITHEQLDEYKVLADEFIVNNVPSGNIYDIRILQL